MAQLLSTVIRKRIWGPSKEKKSLKLLAQRIAVRQKHSLVVSDTRQVILPACRTWGVLQLAPTIPWSTRNKTDFCVTGVNFSSFFLSWNKQSFWLPPQISPAHNFFCEHVSHEPIFLWSVCSHTSARATTKQMLLQGQKESDRGWGGGLTSLNNFALVLFNGDFIFTAFLNRGFLLKVVFPII